MESKLKEYRAIRRRRELIDSAKEKLENSKRKIVNFLIPETFRNMDKNDQRNEEEVLLLENEHQEPVSQSLIMEESVDASELSENGSIIDEKQESWKYFTVKWSIYGLIWVTLYIFFLTLQFGAVFFVISILIGICLNTRTRPKKKGEVSAYSVFNENCVSIDGTLKAEQFEKEIMYGAGGMRGF
ncbi:SAYSvFN domain-containing protein 1 [Vanessa atalanta]|uniref:SAYSvFN domain-containing protein 1 n=1 Tax=Vanessa atalanta TaxID=42275 RepID=UPI001FCD317E|nr:SAYSvFN domain-containing protein 1 [Vanessa atalanta]